MLKCNWETIAVQRDYFAFDNGRLSLDVLFHDFNYFRQTLCHIAKPTAINLHYAVLLVYLHSCAIVFVFESRCSALNLQHFAYRLSSLGKHKFHWPKDSEACLLQTFQSMGF